MHQDSAIALAQEHRPTISVSGVLARELAPPAGGKPIEWLLLTTVPTVMWRGLQRWYDLVALWRLFNHSNDMVNEG